MPRRAEHAVASPGESAVGGAAVTARGPITDDVLQGGEVVIVSLRPHIGAVVLRALPFVLPMIVVGLVGVAWLGVPKTPVATWMGALALLVTLSFAFDWAQTRYVLTDRRVMVIRGGSGFAGRVVSEALVPSVHRVSLEHSVRESLLGLGTLVFVPDHGGRIRWEMLGRAEDVYSIAHDAIERYGRGRLDD